MDGAGGGDAAQPDRRRRPRHPGVPSRAGHGGAGEPHALLSAGGGRGAKGLCLHVRRLALQVRHRRHPRDRQALRVPRRQARGPHPHPPAVRGPAPPAPARRVPARAARAAPTCPRPLRPRRAIRLRARPPRQAHQQVQGARGQPGLLRAAVCGDPRGDGEAAGGQAHRQALPRSDPQGARQLEAPHTRHIRRSSTHRHGCWPRPSPLS
mmetsp:Transcript_27830/g.56018  ORF Transcript_27830/g.56018 Transcript_27830/m.56018 type:complete len:209 (+) Transcript_27830:809-1435(+)